MRRLPSLPRIDRRSAVALLGLAVGAAMAVGAARGAASIVANDYLALGLPRLAAATLHGHLRDAIVRLGLPLAALVVLSTVPLPRRRGPPRSLGGPLVRRAGAVGLAGAAALAGVLALGAAIEVDRGRAAPPARPHVIWIVIDALRADHLGSYGYARDTSPFIDAWARRAVRFNRAYAQESYTIASVASYFTSTYPWEHQVLYDLPRIDTLDPRFVTLAEILREHGYRTAAFVFNPHLKARFNFGQGFDLYDDRKQIFRALLPDAERFETARRIHDKTERLLDGHDGTPLFLYLHYRDVHSPYVPPAPYDRWFPPRDESERERTIALYDGEIRYTDGALSRLFALLAARGIDASNSLVLLTADHGEEFRDPHPGDPGGWFHGRTLYEELIRVPLVLSLPGGALAGRVVGDPVGLVDLVPTILDAVGIDAGPAAAQFQGESLLPLVRGERPAAVVRSGGNHGRLALLSGGWKYLRQHRPTRHDPGLALVRPEESDGRGDYGEELYDLHADPREAVDLSTTRPNLTAELRAAAETQPGEWRRAHRSVTIDPETEEELRLLGYVR